MAQLDLKGFVTAEQDLGGLNELSKTSAAQRAAEVLELAKKKAENKKSSINSIGVDVKDYLTGTVYDPIITNNIAGIVDKGAQYLKELPNTTEIELKSVLSPDTRAASITSQKLKVLKQQKEDGLAYLKTLPGADPIKFIEAFNKKAYLQNDDGTYPDDMSGIDDTKNYVQDIIENSEIWNFGAVDALVKGAGANKSREKVSFKDKKGNVRDTDIEITSPLNMKPLLDKDGHFLGEFEMPSVTYTENNQVVEQDVIDESTGLPKKDSQGNNIKEPVKMLMLDDWETIKTNEPAYRYIKQEIRKHGIQDTESVAGQNYGRAIAFKAVNYSAKAKTGFSEIVKQVEQKAPIIKNVINTGGNTKEEKPTLVKIIPRLKKFLDEKIELHNSNPNKYNDYQEVESLPIDVREIVVKEARFSSGISDLGAKYIKLMYDSDGVIGIYNKKNDELISSLTLDENVSTSSATKKKGMTIPRKGYKSVVDGKTYSYQELIAKGYNDNTIEIALSGGTLKKN